MEDVELTVSLTSLIRELTLAWQKLAIYQEGHPAREHAVGRAHAVLSGLIAPSGSLSFGVSQDGLLGPEEKLKSGAACRLAAALYLREAAVLRFEEGVAAQELEQLLDLLPRHGVSHGNRTLGDELAERGVTHVTVEPVDFTGLVATDHLEDTAGESRSESLWDRIIQRLLNDQRLAASRAILQEPGEGSLGKVLAVVNSLMERYGAVQGAAARPGESLDPNDILRAVAGLIGQVVGDQVTQPAEPDAERSTLRHVAELLGALPEGLREGVLDAAIRELATREASSPGLQSLTGVLSAAQMVGSLRRLRSERVAFSPTLVSLLESLIAGTPAESFGPEHSQEPEQLAGELRGIFSDEDVDRAGQGGGFDDRLFLDLRHHVPIHARFGDLEPYLESLTEDRETILLSITLTDLLRQPLLDVQIGWIVSRQQRTFRSLLASGRTLTATGMVKAVRDLAASDDPGVRKAAERCLEAFREGEILAAIVDTLSEVRASSLGATRRLIELLGPQAIRQLFLVLGDETDLSRRRRIFDLLASLGSAVVPPAMSLLDDPRWYMTRNILSLLQRIGEGIDLKVLFRGLHHSDPRVRLEAVKCIPEIERGISSDLVDRILDDPDPKVAESAVSTFGRAKIASAAAPLVRLLQRRDTLGRHKRLRLKALKALGEIGDPSVLSEIGHCFRSWFAVVSNEERRAAFESLRFYPQTARRPWLKKGRRAPDAKVRAICRRIAAPGAEPEVGA